MGASRDEGARDILHRSRDRVAGGDGERCLTQLALLWLPMFRTSFAQANWIYFGTIASDKIIACDEARQPYVPNGTSELASNG